ncbi:hypothetical protein COT48_03840 [Candidatus Woesearchaeota archaeon CG08_land_8_20_14_0_20_47_9]|nr:MAG: hypothetical protein AUJ69_00030 [Candidatus Woesearchaeota archaeon CG1_02_47_18]PIO03722.1 MAG: hypothetical protein COT48_03840 [Candidatus Woesearchaeota archaeon CG08_land_8_20_14_0_20_47_9]HII30131.1 nucleotidyltransferase family protein [Candidatus Woesearchaeota archaeon]
MFAVILTAGYATRLYPLTRNTAKPLLKVRGRLIIDFILTKLLREEEIQEVKIVTNNRFYQDFLEWSRNRRARSAGKPVTKPITIVNDRITSNETRLGAIGDLAFIVREQGIRDDMLIVAGDNLFNFSLSTFVSFFNEKRAPVILVYDAKDKSLIAGRHGCVVLDNDSRVVDFEEKPENPKTTLACPVFYIIPAAMVNLFEKYTSETSQNKGMAEGRELGNKGSPDKCSSDAPGNFIAWLSKKTSVYAMMMPGERHDIGSIEGYKAAEGLGERFFS